VDQGHQAPWELVAYEVEHIGRRVNLNENIFPVNTLLILLLQYDLTYYTHDAPPAGTATPDLIYCGNMTWAFDTLIKLGASFELMVATLEQIWYAQEHPFIGRNRKLLIKWFIYCVEQWADASRRQGLLFGGEENAIGLAEVLRVVLGSGELGKGPGSEQAWQERGRVMQQLVDEVTR
jgi:nuclear pore complex protein Nup155